MSYYASEEIYDLEQEIKKLKLDNDKLREQLKEKETRVKELECVGQQGQENQPNYLISFWGTDNMTRQSIGNVSVHFAYRPTMREINQLTEQLQSEFSFADVKILAINELGLDNREENK